MLDSDRKYLKGRVYDETRAALLAGDPHVAAVHVRLAREYVDALNRDELPDPWIRSQPTH
jgi:hypothetical protein